jgi:transcriptional regulator of acetoin/glycerol metabolism
MLVQALETHAQLRRAASLVMGRKQAALAQSTSCVSLTAADGRMLDRWVEDADFLVRLDRMNAVAGVSIAESVTGTSSSTITLETERPYSVAGPEHFSDVWLPYTSSSALIRHPLTRQVLGTVNLSVSYTHTSPVLLSWITDVASDIERAILEAASGRERWLLESFLTARHASRHPVICLDDGTVISNAVAVRALSPADLAVLWEHASRCLRQDVRIAEVSLANGRRAVLDMTAVLDGDQAFGAVVHVRPMAGPRPRQPENATGSGTAPPLPNLVGRSPAWRQLCADVHAAGNARTRLVAGGPGSGKLAVCVAGAAREPVVFDAARPEYQSLGGWEAALRRAARIRDRTIVLRHLDRLTTSRIQLTCAFAAQATENGIRVDATVTTGHGSSAHALLSDWFDTVIAVPDLADRLEDLPLLLDTLSTRVVRADRRPVRWLPDAVQTLARVGWSRNIRSLENVVAQVLAEKRFPEISARDLPPGIRTRAARRELTGLERVEANAIIVALRDARGNKREAAANLGIARSTLYRKVRALGIDLGSWNF